MFVDGADDRWFEGRFGAGGATPLTPGAYGPATTDYGSQPWLRVSGTPIYCTATGGDFTVHEISRLPDGNLRSFDVSFEQDCYADHRAAHRGRLRYRAGSTVALAPWLVAGPRPRLPAPVTNLAATRPPPGRDHRRHRRGAAVPPADRSRRMAIHARGHARAPV